MVARETHPEISGLELSVSPTCPPGRREGLEIELLANGQIFNQSHLHNESSIKTQNDEVGQASGSVVLATVIVTLCYDGPSKLI